MSEPAPWPPDRSGRRPASSWIILALSVSITLVMVISLLVRYLNSDDPSDRREPGIPQTPAGNGIVDVRWEPDTVSLVAGRLSSASGAAASGAGGSDPSGPAGTGLAAVPADGSGPVEVQWATEPVNPDTLQPVAQVVAALQLFWSGPAGTGLGPAVPGRLGPVTAVDPGASAFLDGAPGCVSTPGQLLGNAYFCPSDNGMLFDNTALVPLLLDHYGDAGLVAALAHEYGHYVQSVVGPTSAERLDDPATFPALLIELQADCYAGVFLQHTMSDPSAPVRLPVEALPSALAPLVEFHDPADLDPDDPTAHGAAMDRLRATVLGFTTDAATCRAFSLAEFGPSLGREAAAATSVPRWADLSDLQRDTAASLDAFAERSGATVTTPQLRDNSYGQFAAATAGVLDSWDGGSAACLTGAWVGSVTTTAGPAELGGWQSDPDEAALAVLQMARSEPVDLLSFVRGFAEGSTACTAG